MRWDLLTGLWSDAKATMLDLASAHVVQKVLDTAHMECCIHLSCECYRRLRSKEKARRTGVLALGVTGSGSILEILQTSKEYLPRGHGGVRQEHGLMEG